MSTDRGIVTRNVGSVPEAAVQRSASALRTALVGRRMLRFDAPLLVGPAPHAGRLIEDVDSHGKHLEVCWDDGLVLHTHMRMSGAWHLYRRGETWRLPHRQMRASIEAGGWFAVCFNAPVVETYRRPDRRRHPGMGPLGPDLCEPGSDLADAVELLLTYPEPEARVRDVLLDEHVMCGIGNVYRSETLWAAQLSPWAHVGDLSPRHARLIVEIAARLLRARLDADTGLVVYGRNGQGCARCHDTIEVLTVGRPQRPLYWCPGCQVRLDRRLADDTPAMDPHPAAAKFLAELPWRRT